MIIIFDKLTGRYLTSQCGKENEGSELGVLKYLNIRSSLYKVSPNTSAILARTAVDTVKCLYNHEVRN